MQKQNYKLDFKDEDIYCGIDAHLKSWTVSILVKGIICKTFSQEPKAETLLNYLATNYPSGNYHSAYEAGFCGFSAHRDLLRQGIKNIVVNPADIPTTDKEKKQKEDARDSRKIARSLNNNELNPIYVPSLDIDGLRALVRYRKTLVKEINRHKSRVKSLLYYNGFTVPVEIEQGSAHWSIFYWEKKSIQDKH